MTQPWYNEDRVRQPGSVILARWNAERRMQRANPRAEYSLSQGTSGSELYEWMVGGLSNAGVPVNEQTAMSVSAVYACVSLIAGAIASLPAQIYERSEEGRKRADHPYWWLLNEQAHPAWSSAVMWEYLLASLLLKGDGFARIMHASPSTASAQYLKPLDKTDVTVFKNGARLAYRVIEDGVSNVYDQDDIIHVPGPGFNGLNGMSQLRHSLRNSAGIAIAADEFSAGYFKDGARPDMAITTPGSLNTEQTDQLRRQWKERYSGSANSRLPAVLSGGMDVKPISMNAQDAQLIATRQFQVEDIARAMGVPPHMIGHTSNSTTWGTGIEQMSIGFVKYTLQRHLVKIEQEFNRKLWPTRARYFMEFNTAGLERGDYKTRNEGYRVALGRAGEPGWMSVNEVRKLENLPPVDGGDELSQPAVPPQDPVAQSLMATMNVLASREPAAPHFEIRAGDISISPPSVNVTNQVPEQAAPVVNVAAPEVNVTNQVPEQPAPVVNVAAPEVNVTNQVPEQPAPTVNIVNDVQPADVRVELPSRKTETTIVRDASGNIASATQIETDAE